MFGITLLFGALFHFAAASPTTIQSHICQVPNAPSIVQPPDGTQTTEPHITVSGTADANTAITILDNSSQAAAVTSDSVGNFEVDVPLVEHQNLLVAQASNPCHNTADSGSITVIYNKPPNPPNPPTPPSPNPSDNTNPSGGETVITNGIIGPPNLSDRNRSAVTPSQSITSGPLTLYVKLPRELTTAQPSIIAEGAANMPATITIWVNGEQVATVKTDSNGRFRVRIPLSIGENQITITANTPNDSATLQVEATRTKSAQQPPQSLWQRYGKLIVGVISIAIICIVVVKAIMKRRSW
jgi:hypothetical protein